MEFQPLKYIYHSSGNQDAYTLLLLHGTGGDENDLWPVAKNFGKDINVLSLRGNVSEGGMPRFFKRLGMGVFDEQDLTFRTHEMVAFIKELAQKEGFDPQKVVALGYSNGANIIGSTLVLYPDFFAGVIMYRPMQPFRNPGIFHTTKSVPVFASNGKADPTINPGATVPYINMLNEAGFLVTHFNLDSGHNLTQEDLKLSVDWFHTNFQEWKTTK